MFFKNYKQFDLVDLFDKSNLLKQKSIEYLEADFWKQESKVKELLNYFKNESMKKLAQRRMELVLFYRNLSV